MHSICSMLMGCGIALKRSISSSSGEGRRWVSPVSCNLQVAIGWAFFFVRLTRAVKCGIVLMSKESM